jgi:hypothetical protein
MALRRRVRRKKFHKFFHGRRGPSPKCLGNIYLGDSCLQSHNEIVTKPNSGSSQIGQAGLPAARIGHTVFSGTTKGEVGAKISQRTAGQRSDFETHYKTKPVMRFESVKPGPGRTVHACRGFFKNAVSKQETRRETAAAYRINNEEEGF